LKDARRRNYNKESNSWKEAGELPRLEEAQQANELGLEETAMHGIAPKQCNEERIRESAKHARPAKDKFCDELLVATGLRDDVVVQIQLKGREWCCSSEEENSRLESEVVGSGGG
jgi:hypothetical protein